MERLPDTIYIVDPYDEDGNLVTNTEDVCWCEDPAGNENVAYVSRATVAAALPESWYADSPLEFRIQKMVKQWQKLHKREKEVAAALRELRASVAAERRVLFAFVLDEIDVTIAKLGLETTYATTPEERERQQWEARRQWILAGGDSPTMKADASLFVDTMPLTALGLAGEALEETK